MRVGGAVELDRLAHGDRGRRARSPAARSRSGRGTSRSRRAGSWPSTETLPASARRWPSRISTRVVLPAPLGPSRASTSPRATVRSTPSSATWPVVRLAQAADPNGVVGVQCHAIQHRDRRRRFVIGARVEPASPPVGGDRSTCRPSRAGALPLACVNLHDLPMSGTERPAEGPAGARLDRDGGRSSARRSWPIPQPHEEPFVALGLALFVAGLVLSLPRRLLPPGRRFVGLVILGASSCVLAAAQPDGAGFAGIYFVMVIGGMRLDRDAAIVACGGSLAALVAVLAIEGNPAQIAGLLFSRHPVVSDHAADPPDGDAERGAARVARRARRVGGAGRARPGRARAARRARPLALGARRCSSRGRGCWPAIAAPTPRSSTAWSARTSSRRRGLTEARQAIAALRGDELPAAGRSRGRTSRARR